MSQLSSFSFRTNAAYLQDIRNMKLWKARLRQNPTDARRVAHNTALEQSKKQRMDPHVYSRLFSGFMEGTFCPLEFQARR